MSLSPFTKYKLRISCMTYNHANYIEDAMNGFCIQKTEFPFVAMIVDDASTDGEQEVIRKYLDEHFDMNLALYDENEDAIRIAAIHKKNPNCHFLVILLKYNFYSIKKAKSPLLKGWYEDVPYVAMCEGDDYWTDPNKLQMQVCFLESHHDYSMCFHNAVEHYEDGSKNDRLFSNVENCDYRDVDFLKQWMVPTASVVFRKEVTSSAIYKHITYEIKPMFGDTPLFVAASQIGKVRGMASVMSVYRRQQTGAVYHNVFDDPQKRDKILNDYYLIAEVIGPHLSDVIIGKYLGYSYEYRQPQYFVKCFMKWPLKTIKVAFKGLWTLLKRHVI